MSATILRRTTGGEADTRLRRLASLALSAALTVALVATPGCAAGRGFTRHMETTRDAFGVGMAVGGVPSIVAALPITLPLSSLLGGDARGNDALSVLALPGLLPGGALGVLLAAPIAVLELPVALLRARADVARDAAPAPAPSTTPEVTK